jgi:hypothetical protein
MHHHRPDPLLTRQVIVPATWTASHLFFDLSGADKMKEAAGKMNFFFDVTPTGTVFLQRKHPPE